MSQIPILYNVTEWIEENKQFFLPPVCNKMMHQQGQMKLFFVGGPNQRKDYHIDCGEELFLQIKGDMVLKIIEHGIHKDIHIREGEMFLLPCRVPHSPQRQANTVGLVIERDRHMTELDGLRYHIEENGKPTLNSLFEKWFHCEDLGVQLAPIIKEFFASEQFKTGKPLPGTIPEVCPVALDTEIEVEPPFVFENWLDSHRDEIHTKGKLGVFDGAKYQFQIFVYGPGEQSDQSSVAESWIWQRGGSSVVTIGNEEYKLGMQDSLLVPINQRFTVKQDPGSLAFVAFQDQTKATTWPKDA